MNLITYPNSLLQKELQFVEEYDETLKEALDEMYKFMKAHGGIGLAANQVGIDKRLIVVSSKHRIFKLINPEIAESKGEIIYREQCLSLPGKDVETKRFKKVTIVGYDEDGDDFEYSAGGLLAVVFQHEIDHLNGKTILDRRNI